MEVKLSAYEIEQAIVDYCKKHGITISEDSCNLIKIKYVEKKKATKKGGKETKKEIDIFISDGCVSVDKEFDVSFNYDSDEDIRREEEFIKVFEEKQTKKKGK